MLLFEFQNEIGEVNSRRIHTNTTKTTIDTHSNLRVGDIAPDFRIQEWINPIENLEDIDTVTLNQLLIEKPLILSFLDMDWHQNYISRYLEFWENIYPDLKNLGINLLLLTQESSSYIPKTHENIVTQINLAKDHKKEIAYNYKVYSRLFPIWQRVSGVDEDVVSPAVFAINQRKRITYLNTDEGFKLKFVGSDIIKSLY